DESGFLDRFAVGRIVSSDQIHVHIRTIGSLEVGEAQNAFALGEPVNTCCPSAFVGDIVERSGRQHLGGAGIVGGAQRGGREVHAEALAPDGDGAVFPKVEIGGQFVVLIANIALQWSNFQESGLLHRLTVGRIVGVNQVNANVGTI